MATSTPGNLLPGGYLSTRGNQIIAQNGTPVRIDAIGWNGPDGKATLTGLESRTYQDILATVKADGFNTIRIAWSDASLNYKASAAELQANPNLLGLTTLQIFQKVVAYAGSVGLKVIFDHHTNEGGYNGWGGQQSNGLWFDSGPGANGSDGNGNNGTVTAAKFQQDWLTIARLFAGNPTVIGFDLHNEPLIYGYNDGGLPVNWGQGGPTDIRAMYQSVGNAIQAVDPGALIIAEGPQNWGGQLLNGKSGIAPDGDLTLAASKPVSLKIPNKVVYSAHEYPSNIGGEPYDSGPLYVQQMNQDWGYLVARNIAPVWIGEMGASMDGSNGAQADDTLWANTIVPYLNGDYTSLGGPGFSGNAQPVSTGWWLVGYLPGQIPDGYFASYSGSPMPANPAQEAIVSQLAPVGTRHPHGPGRDTADNGHIFSRDNGNVVLTGNDQHVLLEAGARFINQGANNIVAVSPFAKDIAFTDHGNGTRIVINQISSGVTIQDFHGSITFTNALPYRTAQEALAAATSDGHGGMMLGNVDFTGSSMLTADQIHIVRT